MKQLKGDNRGLSLIEVLVAVMILAIVVTPFLHSFVTAATTNSKAKIIHKATVVAQSVMEGFKSEKLEDIANQFNYPEQGFYVLSSGRIGDGTNVAANVEEVIYNSVTGDYEDVVKYEDPALDGLADRWSGVTASTYSEDMGVNGEFKGQTGGIYYFSLENVKEDTSTYDVLVELDAAAYRAGTGGSVDDAHRYNSMDMTQIPVIDMDRDAIWIQKETYTDAAVQSFLASHSGVDEADLRAGIYRTIKIFIEQSRVGSEDRTMVKVDYTYRYRNGGEVWEDSKSRTIFDSTEAGKELRSVYLYYYPLYGTSRDEIIFENDEQLPVDFYVMKQKSATATVDDEAHYIMTLGLQEIGSTEATMQTGLYTNLATNTVSGVEIAPLLHTITLNGGFVELDNITEDDILETEKQDRMFDIAVSVYEAGAKAAGFPEEMRLTTLDGSSVY
uniref:type IV pilus modification PilV family protein n=1 Tax=Acetatifactor sp. TaxID=1872090 RepID=UPI004056B89D